MLSGAELVVEADVDGDGSGETGVFDLSSDVEITFSPATQALASFRDGTIQAIAANLTGIDSRSALRLDIGQGVFVVDVSFISFEGSSGQWGDGSLDPAADATGDGPLRQLSVLAEYLNQGRFDSRQAAKLQTAEYSDGGEYDSLDVAPVDQPSLSFAADDPSAISGSISFVSVASLGRATVSAQQDDS